MRSRGRATGRHRARRRRGQRHLERVRSTSRCRARLCGRGDDDRRPGTGIGRCEWGRGDRPGDPGRRPHHRAAGTGGRDRLRVARRIRHRRRHARPRHRRPRPLAQAGRRHDPQSVTAWAALVHDRQLGEMVDFLRDNPYGLELEGLVEKTVNEIVYSGSFHHLAASDRRSDSGRAVDHGRGPDLARAGAGASRGRGAAGRPRPRDRPTRSRCGSAPSSRPTSRSP